MGNARTTSRKTRKEKGKNRSTGLKNSVKVIDHGNPVMEASSSFVNSQSEAAESDLGIGNSTFQSISDNMTDNNILASNGTMKENDATGSIQENNYTGYSAYFSPRGQDCNRFSKCITENQTRSSRLETLTCKENENVILAPTLSLDNNIFINKDGNSEKSAHISEVDAQSALPEKRVRVFDIKEESILIQKRESGNLSDTGPSSSSECLLYEWPRVASTYFPHVNSHLPAATDRLHLDVGRNWHNHFHQSLLPTVHQARNSQIEGGCNPIMSRRMPMSLDCPPMVRGACGMAPSVAYNYDSGFISRRKCTFAQGFPTCSLQLKASATDNENKYSGDLTDLPDLSSAHELADDCESHWISEDEFEVHAVSGIDYNQYFGGGVMYWNPSDHPASGFSRPPSLSSDDSSWAWHEADMNRAVDDMVAFSSSYSTNGLTSPTASFCSPFDPLGPGHQALGYVMPGNEVPGKVLHSPATMTDTAAEEESGALADLNGNIEAKTGDSLPYPILRPIIIPSMSRDRSRSEFKRSHDRRSPCVPPTRREQPRIKRPPSPVVLCVPRAPPPPPPSPVSDSRKHRGFPTVRSGSSSPRHWGMRGWFNDGGTLEEASLCMDGAEVVWPSWRNNNLSGRSMVQPLPAALLQDRLIAMSQLARDQEHVSIACS